MPVLAQPLRLSQNCEAPEKSVSARGARAEARSPLTVAHEGAVGSLVDLAVVRPLRQVLIVKRLVVLQIQGVQGIRSKESEREPRSAGGYTMEAVRATALLVDPTVSVNTSRLTLLKRRRSCAHILRVVVIVTTPLHPLSLASCGSPTRLEGRHVRDADPSGRHPCACTGTTSRFVATNTLKEQEKPTQIRLTPLSVRRGPPRRSALVAAAELNCCRPLAWRQPPRHSPLRWCAKETILGL